MANRYFIYQNDKKNTVLKKTVFKKVIKFYESALVENGLVYFFR